MATPPRAPGAPKRPTAARAGKARKPAAAPATPKKQAALRKPKRAAHPRTPAEPDALAALLARVTESLADDKAEDILVLDLDGKATFADRMVIATGQVERQLQAMATHVVEKLEEAGRKRIAVEGMRDSDWVLIDAGDIVVHLFRPEARAAYALEKMWGTEFPDAPP